MPADTLDRSLSVRQLARRWAIAPRKVRDLIRRRILAAIDVGTCRRQLRITPEAIAQAEQRLLVSPPPAPRRRRYDDIDPEVRRLLEDAAT